MKTLKEALGKFNNNHIEILINCLDRMVVLAHEFNRKTEEEKKRYASGSEGLEMDFWHGICFNIGFLVSRRGTTEEDQWWTFKARNHNVLFTLFKTWPLFSGSVNYPVRNGEKDFNDRPEGYGYFFLWEKDLLANRLSLIGHMKQELTAVLEESK